MSYLEECFLRGAFYSSLPDSPMALAQCLHTGLPPQNRDNPATFLDAAALRDQVFEPAPVSGGTELNHTQSLLCSQFSLEPIPEPGREGCCRRFIFTSIPRSWWSGLNRLLLQFISKPSASCNERTGVQIITEPKPGEYEVKHYKVFETYCFEKG